mmetsp:Transcript_54051/g.61422  ORF Transcript_54051/g.61422 Transcript_54051/m.61422 type:complete len:88 (+) Transcript_54051:98-361(+)
MMMSINQYGCRVVLSAGESTPTVLSILPRIHTCERYSMILGFCLLAGYIPSVSHTPCHQYNVQATLDDLEEFELEKNDDPFGDAFND